MTTSSKAQLSRGARVIWRASAQDIRAARRKGECAQCLNDLRAMEIPPTVGSTGTLLRVCAGCDYIPAACICDYIE